MSTVHRTPLVTSLAVPQTRIAQTTLRTDRYLFGRRPLVGSSAKLVKFWEGGSGSCRRNAVGKPGDSRRRRAGLGAVPDDANLATKVPGDETSPNGGGNDEKGSPEPRGIRSLVSSAVDIYVEYAKRLWAETGTEPRRRIAKDKASAAIRAVEHIIRGEEYLHLDIGGEEAEAKQRMLDACEEMMQAIHKNDDEEEKGKGGEKILAEKKGPASGAKLEMQSLIEKPKESPSALSKDSMDGVDFADGAESIHAANGVKAIQATKDGGKEATKPKRNRRSILFGAVMGAVVACWVFSGNYIFTTLFTLMTVLGQLEYYRMVMNTGVFPARRITVVGSCTMFVTALFAPELHQVCLPVFASIAMVWFLTMRRQVTTIPEIATTFTGMFYLGYIPSFWVRVRLIGAGQEPTRLAPIVGPILKRIGKQAYILPAFIPKSIHLPITTGAVFIFWTWLCIAFSDVGAYFVGRSFGKTKLGAYAPAAGATSPNKSVEGFLGGCAVSAALGALGAWVQKWPYWYVTGPLHGAELAFLGLLGDLTASMLKRDAGLKDFGDLIPEHGGIMDRVDSFIFTAPYSWLMCAYVIPWLKRFARAKAALG